MKKWQTISVTALTTLALSVGGITTYNYHQTQPYKGKVFTNETKHEKSISSNTSTSSSSSSSEQGMVYDNYSANDTIKQQQSNTEALEQRGGTRMGEIAPITYQVDIIGVSTPVEQYQAGGYYIVSTGTKYAINRLERTGTMTDGTPILTCMDTTVTGSYDISKEFLDWLRYYDPDNTPNSSLEDNWPYFVQQREGW